MTTIKKTRSKKRPKLTTNDRATFIFELIRSDIFSLPRPIYERSKEKAKKKEVTHSAVVKKDACKHTQEESQSDQIACKTCDILIEKLEAYEKVIEKIDQMSKAGLMYFSQVNVGGKPREDWLRPQALRLAKEQYDDQGRFESAKNFHYELCRRLFEKNPGLYVEKAGQNILDSVYRDNSFNPQWSFWKNQPKPISNRWVSLFLTRCRNHINLYGSFDIAA